MTFISYECIARNGTIFKTKVYAEALNYKEQNGGTIKTINEEHISSSEAYCIKNPRKHGSRT